MQAVAGVRRAHGGELQQVFCIRLHIRAHIQHQVEAARIARWPKTGDGGAIDARQLAQADHRQRHQRAGIAAGDGHGGLSVAHAFQAGPHGCALAMAHHLAGLVAHRHGPGGMADFAAPGQTLALADQAAKLCLVTMNDEGDLGVLCGRRKHACDNCRRPAISAHRINGNDNALAARCRSIKSVRHGSAARARAAYAASSSRSTSLVSATTSRAS